MSSAYLGGLYFLRRLLTERAVPVDEVDRLLNLAHGAEISHTGRIYFSDLINTYARVVDYFGDTLLFSRLGFEAGKDQNAVAQLIGNSETIEDAINLLQKYSKVIYEDISMAIQHYDGQRYFDFVCDTSQFDAEYVRYLVEMNFALCLNVTASMLGRHYKYVIEEVGFAHKPGRAVSEYESLYQVPLKFNCTVSYVRFNKAILPSKSVDADPFLKQAMEHWFEKIKFAQACGGMVFSDQVQEHIRTGLYHGLPKLEDVAAKCHVSPATLKRRLKSESTSFQHLLNSVVFREAEKLMAGGAHTMEDVALQLGYSSKAAFSRAYKKYQRSMTPGAATPNG